MWINPFQSTVKHEPVLFEVWGLQPDGPFHALWEYTISGQRVEMPWDDEPTVSYQALDTEYLMNRSGSKFCSPMVKRLLGDNEVISADQAKSICAVLITKYYRNWQRLWETMVAEYNPIHNYNMTETRDLETTDDHIRDLTGTRRDTGTDTMAHGRITDELDSVYGFNSGEDARPTDTYRTEESGDDVQTKNLTYTDQNHRVDDDEGTEHEVTTRSGNIGVTTTQKMIEEERSIWLWNYFDQIFADLDRELTLSVFDPCRV